MKCYYCERCGKLSEIGLFGCSNCPNVIRLTKAKYSVEHYQQIAVEQYGLNCEFAWKKVLFETEISESPYFDMSNINNSTLFILQNIEERLYPDDPSLRKYGDCTPHENKEEIAFSPDLHLDQSYEHNNIPKCPICGSTNIQKISRVKKATSAILFGIFSTDIGKTFECKNCGMKF